MLEENEIILFPIHTSNHWILIVTTDSNNNRVLHKKQAVDVQNKIIYEVDSFQNSRPEIVNSIWYFKYYYYHEGR